MRNFAILLAVDCLGTNTVSNMIPFANQVCVEAENITDCVGNSTQSNCDGYGCFSTEQISNSLLTVVGPITLISNKMCLCEYTPGQPKYYGVSCSADAPPADNELCGHCQNSGSESAWDANPYTGCDCAGTEHWGWYCDLDNKLLCEHVDREDSWVYGSKPQHLEPQLTLADCGECRGHADCQNGTGTCVHEMENGKPRNYCLGQACDPTEPLQHGNCLNGNLKCHHGWKGDNCSEPMPCEERCLNGGADLCDEYSDEFPMNFTCKCHDSFTGQYCQTPSACHPAFCDLETSICAYEQCVSVQSSCEKLEPFLILLLVSAKLFL